MSQFEDGPPKNQLKLHDWATHLYPPCDADNDDSFKKNKDLLVAELSKSKPRIECFEDVNCEDICKQVSRIS